MRFCAVRPSNRPEERRPGGEVGGLAEAEPVEPAELLEEVESARSERNLVVSSMVFGCGLSRWRVGEL